MSIRQKQSYDEISPEKLQQQITDAQQKIQGAFYRKLFDLQEDLEPLVTGVVHPTDENSLKGAVECKDENLIVPILLGPLKKIQAVADEHQIDLGGIEIIDLPTPEEAAFKAVEMASKGEIEALMKGKIKTNAFMGPIVNGVDENKTHNLRVSGRRMSHVFAMHTPNYHKPLYITDAAVNIHPDVQQKAAIIQNAADLFRSIEKREPRVAILSMSEKVLEDSQSSVDAQALVEMAKNGEFGDALVSGPLAFDLAVDQGAVEAKGMTGDPVAGDADIIVVHSVEVGNPLYKSMAFLFNAKRGGVVLGAKVPVILTSRSADAETREASAAMALIHARHTADL